MQTCKEYLDCHCQDAKIVGERLCHTALGRRARQPATRRPGPKVRSSHLPGRLMGVSVMRWLLLCPPWEEHPRCPCCLRTGAYATGSASLHCKAHLQHLDPEGRILPHTLYIDLQILRPSAQCLFGEGQRIRCCWSPLLCELAQDAAFL